MKKKSSSLRSRFSLQREQRVSAFASPLASSLSRLGPYFFLSFRAKNTWRASIARIRITKPVDKDHTSFAFKKMYYLKAALLYSTYFLKNVNWAKHFSILSVLNLLWLKGQWTLVSLFVYCDFDLIRECFNRKLCHFFEKRQITVVFLQVIFSTIVPLRLCIN